MEHVIDSTLEPGGVSSEAPPYFIIAVVNLITDLLISRQ